MGLSANVRIPRFKEVCMPRAWADARVPVLRITLVALSAVVLAGCHVPGTGSSGAASGSGPVTVAVVRGIDNAPLSVAAQDGLFQQHGLNVVVKYVASFADEYRDLTSGQAQIAGGDYTGFFDEESINRAPLQLIADGYDAASDSVAILTLPSSGITTAQQLVNQPVATPPALVTQSSSAVPYNIQTLAAEEVLQNDGVSPSSVNWSPMSAQAMIGALQSGRVAAILATEPYILEAEEQLGAVEVLDASSGVTSGLPLSGYFSLHSYAQADPSAVQAFQAALDQAQSDCAQRGPVQAVLPNLTGISQDDAALVTLGTYPTSLNVGQVQRVAALMYDSGMTSSQVNVNT
jgi:NitT/TauT family transport system substrate-binding protein